MLLALALPLAGLAQKAQYSISGAVTDYSGLPLIGASVVLTGPNSGTVTDVDGQYLLSGEADAGAYTLQVTYVGYSPTEKEITLSAGQNTLSIDFNLAEDVLDMEEVVVVGSSVTTKRKQLGNSINVLKSDKLTVANPQGVTGALQGKLPGARITQNSGDPAGGFSVQLRGASTLLGSSEPLYVIDGVIISNSTTNVTNINAEGGASVPGTNRLSDINPNDISDITVINGAAAAAQYGSRASNGVVLITTKRGKSGKPSFSYSSGFNVNELRKKVYVNLLGQQFGSADQRLYPIAGTDPATGNLTVGANFSSETVPVTRYDYQDEIFQTGYGTDQHLSVRGGNEQSNYYASLSYTYNEGIVTNTDFQRYGARFRFNQSVNDWASFSIGLNYNNSFSNEKPDGNVFWSPVNAFNITNNIWDITQRDELGNLQAVEPTRVNPLSVIEDFDINQEVNRAISDFQLKLFPFKGFTIDYILGLDTYGQEGNIFIPPYPYSPVNPTYFNDGYASTANNNVFLINNDINVAYETEFGGITSITKAGYSDQFSRNTYTVAQGRGLAPFVETVNGASIILNPSSNTNQLRIWGYYLQQTFGFKDRLFLTAAARIDAASSFNEDNRNILYPKVSASYVVSSEPFWKNSALGQAVSLFKLRASWGQAGNLTAIGPYARFSTYNTGNLGGSVAINQSNTLADPNVRPEVNTETELGADLSFLKDRLGMSFTWYNQDIDDLLVSRSLAASQGGRAITTNVGSLENKGVEVLIYGTPVRRRDFSWDLSLNFSRNRNKVTNLGQARTAVGNVTGAPIFLVDGQPLGVFFGTYIARDENGQPLLTPEGFLQQERGDATANLPQRDANGQPTGTPLQRVIGDPNPDYILGGSTTFRYKRFGVTAVIESVQGQDVFDADHRTRQGVGIGEFAEQELTGELPRGWIWAMYPILEWRVQDGSFTKLRELSVSYTIPKIGGVLENTTISVGGRNLFSIDNFPSYDPETNAGGQSNLMRNVNFGNVPIPRVYTLNIRTNF
ncbi:SusC/RagA family TonB-linked outer membrane protein [Phaeodactylibacter luteus]|uniref:SusC/RagA family TonB-linked outer membrane protein n=2 Tax=Phaeodactylibacter luteus TaxID=1564516 RepID=A0A5C6RRH3_9BACT|nr:SusC/RagA family TonB-linked outer membrane protein [Phaeodactylibacter luteus]